MKATVIYKNTDLSKDKIKFYNKFIKFLQKEFPLKQDITIHFLGEREGKMTTGSRNDKSELKVLCKNRMSRDILRTLAHEWVHEHQLNVLNREHGPDIGGQNEDEANAFAGQMMKKFEKKYPREEDMMYD
jgi:hypothetical protein